MAPAESRWYAAMEMLPSSPDTLRIRTAENVGIGYSTAGLGSRLLAQLVDHLVLVPSLVVLAIAGTIVIDVTTSTDVGRLYGVIGLGFLLVFFCYPGYFALGELTMNGQTLGKRAMHLRVIRQDGGAVRGSAVIIRNLVRLVDVFMAGCGALVMFFSPTSRRFGDLLAGTVVVRDVSTIPLQLATSASPVMLRTPDPGPPIDGLSRLGEHEYSLLRLFLSHLDLHVEQRHRLCVQMAARLCDRMQMQPTAPERGWVPELFLERTFLQLEQRLGAAR